MGPQIPALNDKPRKLPVDGRGIPHLAKNERDAPNFLHAAPDKAACAPFVKERRMKFTESTKPHGKSGMWGTRSSVAGMGGLSLLSRVASTSRLLGMTREEGDGFIESGCRTEAFLKAIVGLRPSFSAHVRLGERGAPVQFPSDLFWALRDLRFSLPHSLLLHAVAFGDGDVLVDGKLGKLLRLSAGFRPLHLQPVDFGPCAQA